jgi:hypothetical protein
MNTLQFIAWIFVHIAISIFAPIALLPFLAIGRSEPSRLMVISTLFIYHRFGCAVWLRTLPDRL